MGKRAKEEGFCNDCPFQEPGDKHLECHRLPPAACSHGLAFQWKFPQVGANWWCGEHPTRKYNTEVEVKKRKRARNIAAAEAAAKKRETAREEGE